VQFYPIDIHGAYRIELDVRADERGHFARTWCAREFEAHGLPTVMVQGNSSFNSRCGTLRGLHFQRLPSLEGKLVRCVQGEIQDVILDLRRDSPSFMRHFSLVLSSQSQTMLYIPPGCAHGFETLADDTVVSYLMSDYYRADLSDGVRWDDPAFGIRWAIETPVAMSARDRDYPDLQSSDSRIFGPGALP
jgi:dTDP-4-dehydrorhamnose 3,5-epimerase